MSFDFFCVLFYFVLFVFFFFIEIKEETFVMVMFPGERESNKTNTSGRR